MSDKFIPMEDMLALQSARYLADKADLEKKNSELESRNLLLLIYLKYGLSLKDHIDFNTGKIMVAPPEIPPAPPEENPEEKTPTPQFIPETQDDMMFPLIEQEEK